MIDGHLLSSTIIYPIFPGYTKVVLKKKGFRIVLHIVDSIQGLKKSNPSTSHRLVCW